MNKEELLQELNVKINSGEISREEIESRLMSGPLPQKPDDRPKHLTHLPITKLMYVLGSAIVTIGIVIFVYQIWDDIGIFGRIFVTLGLGLFITAIGYVLREKRPAEKIGQIFYFIGGMLIPSGIFVTVSELYKHGDSLWPYVFGFAIIIAFYLVLLKKHKDPILTFFAIANGTIFIYLLVGAIITGPYYQHQDIYTYLTMIVGVCYLLFGYSFHNSWNKSLVGVLYFFGSLEFFSAAFSRVFNSVPWQILFFLLVFAGFFLSVRMKSLNVLAFSTLFLVAHISYISGKYFADSLGWPIYLIIMGFIFIAVGYASINISKKYIKKEDIKY